MLNMSGWDWALLAIAMYVAVTSLVMLMRRRRDQLLNELAAAADEERRRHQNLEDLRTAKRKRESKAA